MKMEMGPPTSSTNPSPPSEMQNNTVDESSASSTMQITHMGPPPPKNPIFLESAPAEIQIDDVQQQELLSSSNVAEPVETTTTEPSPKPTQEQSQSVAVPYTIPPWSEPPCHLFSLEVLKDGSIIDHFEISEKGAYMFGRVDLCDFVLDHPTISRFHAVLQFKRNGDAYLFDLGSTHGTSINKTQVKKKVYVDLHVGDVIRFGHSSRLYIFQGPAELMLPERDLESIRNAKIRSQIQDREASLQRARREASLADGISWGMGEDAIEEAEDDVEEITWQTYKGQLTEKQEKTRDKVIKRTEKIANMKKEIDAIRVKDISQGGLTQGQQTQIARNEQRISQILEELENLEETLNQSIQESLGARSGKIFHGKKKGAAEDDDELLSDDEDEFYDRTKKKSINKAGEKQSIETADTLLDKKDTIIKEMEEKTKLLLIEKNKMESETEVKTEAGDALDAFMSGLSSQLVIDKTVKIQEELSSLQSELDRVVYLLKIADPTGEADKMRASKHVEEKPKKSEIPVVKQPALEVKSHQTEKPMEASKRAETGTVATEKKLSVFTAMKPQWLGAVQDAERKETQPKAEPLKTDATDGFVDYKDRKKVLIDHKAELEVDSDIESAAPGLILRKRKQVESTEASQQSTSSVGGQIKAEDAVALLLKHKRGYCAPDDEGEEIKEKKPKKVLGPERPSFLDDKSDYESWVPPEGQLGDGRTSLNDRYGY